MIEEINTNECEKKSESVSSFIKQLYPHKNVDDILIDTREFDPPKKTAVKTEVVKTEVKSRKERRFLERKQKKSAKSNKSDTILKIEKERSALDQIKAETRAEIGKRLAPILFGIK